ncbi:MAG: HAD family hydrolase [Candidatus Aphodosoma sp.]
MEKVLLVDICGTLFNSNTTFDFLDYYIHDESYCRFRRLMKTSLWRYFNSAVYRLLGLDLSRRIALSRLAGYSLEQLGRMADVFYTDYLLSRRIQPVWQLMADYRSRGVDVVLVSGTIDPVAHAIARHLCVNRCVSSKLGYTVSGICTGRLVSDALRTKRRELDAISVCPPYAHIVTDNPNDISLARYADCTTIVVHGGIRRWRYLTRNLKNVYFIHNVQQH